MQLSSQQRADGLGLLTALNTVLFELAECARDEALTPPARLPEMVHPLTRIPGFLARGRMLLAAFEVGGFADRVGDVPPKVHEFLESGYTGGRAPTHVLGDALSAPGGITALISQIDAREQRQ